MIKFVTITLSELEKEAESNQQIVMLEVSACDSK